jgi:glycosyltransferase involved in cell wall biosynthesis
MTRLIAYHENVESVAALLDALSRRIEVHSFRVVNPVWYLNARWRRPTGFYWDSAADAAHRALAMAPGVRRFPRLSAAMLRRSYQAATRHYGRPDYLLIDSPYLEPLAAAVDVPLIYLAADAYRYYGWPRERTVALESKILGRAEATFAVSELLADDFRAAGTRAVFRSPTAVGKDFVEATRQTTVPPMDLASVPGPRVGVVGKINSTYDWNLIETVAAERPAVSFVFIGPLQEHDSLQRKRIQRVFGRPNVYALGMRPHAELPPYLNAMDVLLSPLDMSAHNDRRFPLRLCEYLTTDRPVITTAIHEASAFAPHVVVVRDASEMTTALDAALGGKLEVNVEGRQAWLQRNTWEARATNMLASLESIAALDPAPDG